MVGADLSGRAVVVMVGDSVVLLVVGVARVVVVVVGTALLASVVSTVASELLSLE